MSLPEARHPTARGRSTPPRRSWRSARCTRSGLRTATQAGQPAARPRRAHQAGRPGLANHLQPQATRGATAATGWTTTRSRRCRRGRGALSPRRAILGHAAAAGLLFLPPPPPLPRRPRRQDPRRAERRVEGPAEAPSYMWSTGTTDYMAPEVFLEAGYERECDCGRSACCSTRWSSAIPFYADTKADTGTRSSIGASTSRFPRRQHHRGARSSATVGRRPAWRMAVPRRSEPPSRAEWESLRSPGLAPYVP